MTEDEVIALLKRRCDNAGGVPRWADKHGLHYNTIYDVFSKRRSLPPRVLEALKLKRVTIYLHDHDRVDKKKANPYDRRTQLTLAAKRGRPRRVIPDAPPET